ncbi:MAG: type II toxin-antitoxin system RelE/ParE family toxin [Thiohalocapsa sp.]|nr:type II toxin-antitoxin system RelE/ParE family toxin [Thiohalocapsa sp.]MCF7991416.1 type II toxin-antitoxin system RelE/ParE family toxin [Thiohalocapsa sp.]
MPAIAITFAVSALEDLEGIKRWYAEQGVADIGERYLLEIIERIEALQAFPEIGRIVPEIGRPWLRELIHPPFRIVYRHDREVVRIVRVWRAERLLRLPPEERPE